VTGRRVLYNATTPERYRVRGPANFTGDTVSSPDVVPGRDIPTSTRDAEVLGSVNGATSSSNTG